MKKEVGEVQISTGTIVRFFLVFGIFALLYILRDIVLILLTAIVVASAIEPGTSWLSKHGLPRVAAVLTIYLSLAIVIIGVVYLFIPTLLQESVSLFQTIPQYLETLSLSASSSPSFLSSLPSTVSLQDFLLQFQGAASGAGSSVLGFISTIFGGLVSALIITVISFYLAVQEDGVGSVLRVLVPPQHEEYMIDLWRRSRYKIGRWLQGQLLLTVFVGLITYVGLLILGVPNAFLLALLAASFELIPMFGPIIAGVPAIAIAASDGGLTLGLLTAGLYLVVQQLENHVLVPLVVKKVVGVPSLVVILSLLVGGSLAGFIGLLIAVPLAAVLMEFYNDLEKSRHGAREMVKSLD